MLNKHIYDKFVDLLMSKGRLLPDFSGYSVEEIWYFPDEITYSYVTIEVDKSDNHIVICTYSPDAKWIYSGGVVTGDPADHYLPKSIDLEDLQKAVLRVQLSLY